MMLIYNLKKLKRILEVSKVEKQELKYTMKKRKSKLKITMWMLAITFDIKIQFIFKITILKERVIFIIMVNKMIVLE